MGERDSTLAENSLVVAVVRDLQDLGRWLESSSVVRSYRRLTARLHTSASNSALAHVLALFTTWVCNSFIYNWLTKEPEPDVIVIDLRETYTVGPVIAILDRLAPTLERVWHESGVHRLLEAVRTASQGTWITDSRTVQVLVAALEPPEQPDDNRRE
jgi:hypothetical protein